MSPARNDERTVLRAFNGIAAKYDSVFDAGEVTRTLRARIHALIASLVAPSSHILDINCGTGTDALAIAAMGHSVVGVDIAPLMIKEARVKGSGNSRVRFAEGTFSDLGTSQQNDFDLVLSNFGGLNCAPDVAGIGTQVDSLLKPDGYFVAVVMPPFSLWEVSAKIARGQFITAARRVLRAKAIAAFDRETFSVHYHTPGALTKALRPHFRRTDLFGLNILSPPPHARRFAASFPRLSLALTRLDDLIRPVPVLRSMGDHYVAVFRKVAAR